MAAVVVSGVVNACEKLCRWPPSPSHTFPVISSSSSSSSASLSSSQQPRVFPVRINPPAEGGDLKTPASHVMLSRRMILQKLASFIIIGQVFLPMDAHPMAEEETGIGEGEMEAIQFELKKVLKKSKAAGMLRLVFHDAGTFNTSTRTGGMNGSIIYELGRPENAGLERTIKILEVVKASLDESTQVSWADLIAVAGAEAVALCGGPCIPIRLGRLDATSGDPEGELPAETLDATSLKKMFSRKGFKTQEMVVLSGAHTLGRKGFGSPSAFDNTYFKVLLQKPWAQDGNEMGAMVGLPSDRTLVDDAECLRWIREYASDQSKFFEDFTAAYVKLIDAGAVWRSKQTF